MLKLQRSTSIAVCLCAAVLAACAKKDEAAVDTSTMSASTVTTAPAPVNLADVAGRWNVRAVPTSGADTSTTTYVLTATSTTSGWTITFPGRAPIPVTVSVDGDSIMLAAGPFTSARRKGVPVETNSVARLQGGSVVGSTTAHYKQKAADSVLVLNFSGTRAP